VALTKGWGSCCLMVDLGNNAVARYSAPANHQTTPTRVPTAKTQLLGQIFPRNPSSKDKKNTVEDGVVNKAWTPPRGESCQGGKSCSMDFQSSSLMIFRVMQRMLGSALFVSSRFC
ncbi:hypothetical protein ACE1BM_06085, partial [Aeromonas jandaei]